MTTRKTIPLAAAAALIAAGVLLLATDRGGATPPFPAAEQIALFDRVPPAAQPLPAAVVQALEHIPGNATQGRGIRAKTVRLAADLGMHRAALYAYPTDRGSVCFVLTESGAPATCVDRFDRRTGAAGLLVYAGEGVPATVAGIRGPDVARVEAHVNGVRHDAVIAPKVVFFQLPTGATREDLDAVVVTYRDGSSERFFDW